MIELPPRYESKEFEEKLYKEWESRGLFHAEPDPARTPYTIVIPPPNVTGILHMGHALNNTIQDILIRYQRMRGANALWIPGTDHAGIATQNVVEKKLAKEGKKRQDLGREAFIQQVWAWKEQYGSTILYQLRRLGSSCDWARTRFTMDEGLSQAVAEVFVRLYDRGLIYRGNYIINWCPRCQTALADEEAPRKETRGKLWFLRYPIKDAARRDPQHIVVATTRPETMLGDTAIAVHPKDKRYKTLIGRTAILPIVGRELRIIADDLVDPEFGTGAVKVTPAHDPVDFQLAKRHDLEILNIMTGDAHMTNVPEPYNGLSRELARQRVVEELERQGVLEKIEDHQHGVGHCYRCDTVVEPRLSPQWFVRMKPLAEPAIKAVKEKKIAFTPTRWTKVYLNWMENIQDWCISRQIWWGHRLPVYYCKACRGDGQTERAGVVVSKTRPERCPTCGSTDLEQDPDVLDTWFSSWLWPFSTLGWPQQTKDLEYFYPTNTLVTAPEIIFFWVARMIMAGYFCMGERPFSKVYIHGTVRDITGKKMSKSLGNVIDPIEIIDRFGTDALRYTLVTATAVGQDLFLSEDRFTVGRNFANKLWNVTRYALATAERCGVAGERLRKLPAGRGAKLTDADRWILSRLNATIGTVTKAIDRFNFNEAAQTLYDFVWHDVCDWYVEISKIQLGIIGQPEGGQATVGPDASAATLAVLWHVLETSLRLLHPIVPFVTEALWQFLQQSTGGDATASIMVAEWPKASKRSADADLEARFNLLQSVIAAIRNTRSELNVPLDTRPAVQLASKQAEAREFLAAHRAHVRVLAQVGEVAVAETVRRTGDAAATIVDGVEVVIPLAGLIDAGKERQRLEGRMKELTDELARIDAKLADAQFTQRAPEQVVQQTRDRHTQVTETIKKFHGHLQLLKSL